jgi:hypothetical protein
MEIDPAENVTPIPEPKESEGIARLSSLSGEVTLQHLSSMPAI